MGGQSLADMRQWESAAMASGIGAVGVIRCWAVRRVMFERAVVLAVLALVVLLAPESEERSEGETELVNIECFISMSSQCGRDRLRSSTRLYDSIGGGEYATAVAATAASPA